MNSKADAIADSKAAVADRDLALHAIALLDLTSLGDNDDEAGALSFCARGLEHGVAAVCLWPQFVPAARAALAGSPVKLATVANFPAGGEDIGAAADEVAACFAAGANEVDVVAPVEAILAGDIGLVGDLVELCVAHRPAGGCLKVILETARLEDPATITAAGRAAVMAGADFLKTSTGKSPAGGASLEAAQALLQVSAEAGGRVGVKVSGGVRTADDAAQYLALANAVLGPDWPTPVHFRIGASSLLDDLLRRL